MIPVAADIVAAAFAFAAAHTGYAMPAELPQVLLVPREYVAEPGRIAAGTGEPPRARTIYGLGIVMADDLGPLSIEAILAHEATHWLQETTGSDYCPGFREWQAHVVHADYLSARGVTLEVDWDRLNAEAAACFLQ